MSARIRCTPCIIYRTFQIWQVELSLEESQVRERNDSPFGSLEGVATGSSLSPPIECDLSLSLSKFTLLRISFLFVNSMLFKLSRVGTEFFLSSSVPSFYNLMFLSLYCPYFWLLISERVVQVLKQIHSLAAFCGLLIGLVPAFCDWSMDSWKLDHVRCRMSSHSCGLRR